jgi:hypothetical protein
LGYDRHVRRLREALRSHRDAYADLVATHFPVGTRLTLPDGGMLLWVQLPEGASGDTLFAAALDRGIKIAPGSYDSVTGIHVLDVVTNEEWLGARSASIQPGILGKTVAFDAYGRCVANLTPIPRRQGWLLSASSRWRKAFGDTPTVRLKTLEKLKASW